MKISLLTDAPKHNLALMKLSTYHKSVGNEVLLNMPIIPADYTYASVLFEKNLNLFNADEYGGPAFYGNPMEYRSRNIANSLPEKIRTTKPDYSLYGLDFSLGYTYRPCFRNCDFCKVRLFDNHGSTHNSIDNFHYRGFSRICLLNNNTFFDKRWKETFEEIWEYDLTVIDENGYDLRLLDDEKADALKRTKFQGMIHFAWDRMEDEKVILRGLALLKKYKIHGHIYVLIGYDTTLEDDLYRCQKLVDFGQDPYIMPFKRTEHNRRFKRFFDTFMWRKYKTIKEAWTNYRR
jgi:radical SAM superfamily enzyme YgiQ (UPF0313 family)